MCENMVELDRTQMTVLIIRRMRMRIAGWILKTINTHLEYVIRIAFPRQQLSRERA